MAISKVKCWHSPTAVFAVDELTSSPVTLELVKKSMLKTGYRAFCLTDRDKIESEDWYASYLLNDKVFFYIDGSGLFKLVNIDLVENEFYFEKSNLPTGYKPWIFYSWQSDYNPSRGHIKDAIEEAVNEINGRKPRSEIEIVESTREGDGAGDIVDKIKQNIDRSLYCVFDITNVVSLDAANPESKSYPNANVSYELGYALSRKNDNQVFLAKRRRDDFAGDKTPFDFEQRRRKEYDRPAELKADLKGAIISHFERVGFID